MSLRLGSTVGVRGQTVIPKPIRDQLKLQPGEKVWFRLDRDRIVIEREDPMAVYEAFVGAIEKRPLGKIDWDERYKERWRRKRSQSEG